jgi:6-phosphofructokinase 1
MRTLIIVSGGDAPGINTALYHYALLAERYGDQVVGAVGGMAGAVNGHLTDLRADQLAAVSALGGTYLASSREPVLRDPLNRTRLIETISRHQIDNIVLMGGDGTLRHLPPILSDMGLACLGIPTTIDNDVPGTSQTIGFDTACNAALPTIDGLMMTARALPGRIFSVETLGGSTGFLALDTAFVAGAQAVLLPEFDYDESWLADRLKSVVARDNVALLVLSEGVARSRTLADDMQVRHSLRIRDTRLGHGQRGAVPTHHDRWLARRMVEVACTGLHDGLRNGTVVVQDSRVTVMEGLLSAMPRRIPNRQLYEQINGLQ